MELKGLKCIQNVRLPEPYPNFHKHEFWSIHLDSNYEIKSICPEGKCGCSDFQDWGGDYLSPMGIDLQVNGGLGLAFDQLDIRDLPKIHTLLDFFWQEGVEGICPTIISSSKNSLRNSLQVLQKARENRSVQSCQLLGAHLEGPFLSKKFSGAHKIEYLRSPEISLFQELVDGYEDQVSLITIAPELNGAMELIKYLIDKNIVVAIGHTGANSECCHAAFDAGATMITHSFNAMKSLHHRDPGPIGAAALNGNIFFGLIADGIHIHPEVLSFFQKSVASKIVLVSDAMAPYGLNLNHYEWDGRIINIKNGACRLDDGTLAGSTLSLLGSCSRFSQITHQLGSAIWSATVTPRFVLQKGNFIEDLLIGKTLKHLLRWYFSSDSDCFTWKRAI